MIRQTRKPQLSKSMLLATPAISTYAYKLYSAKKLFCAPIEAGSRNTKEQSSDGIPGLPYVFPPIISSITSISAESDDDSDIENNGQLMEYLRIVAAQSFEIVKMLTRWTIYSLPESVQKNLSTDEQSLIPIGVGVIGGLAGMSVKHRFNSVVVFGSGLVFTTKLLVEFGFVTIHWEKIEEVKRKYPVIGQTIALFPAMFESFMSLPMASFFAAGFLLGFRFG
jgi:uncharacterized membrane protein (Fun14 family)